jgi:basic membrane protein A
MQGIGVDADQGYLGAHIITSALKKVDVAVFDTIKQVQDGTFKGGEDTIFDVKSGGVGLGKVSEEGSKYQEQVDQVAEQIKSGELTDIPTEVK